MNGLQDHKKRKRYLKTHKNLFAKIVDINNLRSAIMHAAKGKRKRTEVIRVLQDVEGHALALQEMLVNNTYTSCIYRQRTSTEGSSGKERLITSIAFFPDQCIHWAIILVMKPVIMGSSYNYSCGCMPNRGVHFGKRAIVKWLRNDRKHTRYCAKLDIRKYYQSIDHGRVISYLERSIYDHRLMRLFKLIIKSYEPGLPIGYLTSQWLGNFYLQGLDCMVKQDLKIKYYIRYMDDMVLFGPSKRKLHKAVKAIDDRLLDMGLQLKDNWQVFPLKHRALDFMGFRFYHHKTILRRSLMLRICRRVVKVWKKKKASFRDAAAIISYMGWIRHSDSYGLYRDRIKPHVSIGKLKNIVRQQSLQERDNNADRPGRIDGISPAA